MEQIAQYEYEQALEALKDEDISDVDKVEMLMQIAMSLQMKPKSVQQLIDAVALYDRALAIAPSDEPLLLARVGARKATALHLIPSEDPSYLDDARVHLESALSVFETEGLPAELAEAHMNLGLVLQSLCAGNRAKITDAISHYQKALRTFNAKEFPTEYAILHNNLATAFLSIPMSDERAKMREALAVQSFQSALEVVTLEEHPNEYAMLQNNLGNALQYSSSAHIVENNLRALEAYEEALKVRTRRNAPLAYANTIANKANCLLNLPDDPEVPESGNSRRTAQARSLYSEAKEIFEQFEQRAKASMIADILAGMGVD